MFTCPPNLIHSFPTVCEIITFKVKQKVFFHYAREGHVCKMCAKSHIHQSYGGLPKKLFSAKGYAEIHIQRPYFDNKNSIWKIRGLKIQIVETCSSASSTRRNFYFWKTLKSRFLVVFQSFIYGQILANFGSFGQFWADFLAFTVVESMPKLRLESSKPHNFSTVSPNVTCNGLLESYHPYL
jgi:hypothetical protein